MVDVGTLFPLLLVALMFVVIGMFFLVYLMVIGEREKNRLRARLEAFGDFADAHECYYFFGYLSGYPMEEEPIPDECFGCPKAIDCMNAEPEIDNVAPEEVEPEVVAQAKQPKQTKKAKKK